MIGWSHLARLPVSRHFGLDTFRCRRFGSEVSWPIRHRCRSVSGHLGISGNGRMPIAGQHPKISTEESYRSVSGHLGISAKEFSQPLQRWYRNVHTLRTHLNRDNSLHLWWLYFGYCCIGSEQNCKWIILASDILIVFYYLLIVRCSLHLWWLYFGYFCISSELSSSDKPLF